MLNRKILIAGISVFMIGVSTSSNTWAQKTSHRSKHRASAATTSSKRSSPSAHPTHVKTKLTRASKKRHGTRRQSPISNKTPLKKTTRKSTRHTVLAADMHPRHMKRKSKRVSKKRHVTHRRSSRLKKTTHRTIENNAMLAGAFSIASPSSDAQPMYLMAASANASKKMTASSSMQPSRKATRRAASTASNRSSSGSQPSYVTAKPTHSSEKVTATRMQPSTSSTTPPQKTSSALGIGPKSRIHINGFLSAGGSATNTSANYTVPNHGTIDSHFNFASNSLIGLQFTADLAKHLQVVTQFVADGDNTNGNVAYRVNAEWAFLRYTVTPGYQVRAGRFRIPAFLYSETEQVGYSYPYFQLPNEVYRLVPFDNVNGVDMIYRYTIGQTGWTLMIQPYYGANTNTYTIYNAAAPNGINVNFTEEDVKGVVAGVSNPNFELRGTYVDLSLTGDIPGGATLFSSDNTNFYSVGAKWTPGEFMLIAEYADRDTPSQIASLQAYYGSVGWRFGKFVPLFTYARLKTTNANKLLISPLTSELPQDQQSYTLGFDYTFNSNLDIKASISQITPLNGTFGLFSTDPGKRHVWLYGASINAIF